MLKNLYQADYFLDRHGNNRKRLLSFHQERLFIENFTSPSLKCLDIGCSTGEFLKSISWSGEKYGMEISQLAAEEAMKNGIKIINNYPCDSSFDAIFYRGTIQHLDSPFTSIQSAVASLKPGGMIFFIATPNSDSIYYRLFGTLPALDPARNFYIPSASSLKSICKIYGLRYLAIDTPYLRSPYSNVFVDHILFMFKLILSIIVPSVSEKIQFPFWSSMMNLAFVKA